MIPAMKAKKRSFLLSVFFNDAINVVFSRACSYATYLYSLHEVGYAVNSWRLEV